jgi:hypothetical protein
MPDSDDTLIDKIRAAIAKDREARPQPAIVILPTGWLDLGDVKRLAPLAAERFDVAEDDVTIDMLFHVAATESRP